VSEARYHGLVRSNSAPHHRTTIDDHEYRAARMGKRVL